MVIINCINQCFTLTIRIEIPSDFFEYCSIKVLGNNLTIEAINFKLHIVFKFCTIKNFSGYRIVNRKLFTLAIFDTFNTKLGADIVRSIVIHKVAVDDSLTIGVVENGFSENLSGMKSGCCCQGNFYSIEVFDDCTILTDIVILIPVKHLCLAHFFIQDVATVCLINNNQIIIADRRHGIPFWIKNTLYKTLYGCNMDLCFSINILVFQALYVINGVQGHQVFNLDFFEYILSLLAQCGTVNQEQNSLETITLNKTINHTKNGTGLTCASCHRKKNSLLSFDYSFFGSLNSINLIFTEI